MWSTSKGSSMFAKVVTSSLRSSSRATACFTSTVRSMSSNSTSGRLYTWGSGGEGQLGYDVSTSDKTEVKGVSGSTQRVPRQVFLEDGTTPVWKQVACGNTVTLGLTADGKLYSWGSCEYYSLGLGKSIKSVLFPTLIPVLADIPIARVDVGEYHCAAVSTDGDVFTWGWGGGFLYGYGGLGHGDHTTQPQPALVESLQGVKIADVSCGQRHTLALSVDGVVYSWGNGEFGRCGNGKSQQPVPEPVDVLSSQKCTAVSAGQQFSTAVTASGDLWVWGKNDQAQLGLGGNLAMDINTMEEYPLKIEKLSGQVATVAAGRSHCLALTKDAKVYTWGARNYLEPHLMKSFIDNKITPVSIAAGDQTSAAIDSSGVLYTWGKNIMSGALGHGTITGQKQPTKVAAFDGIPIAQVGLGRHSAAVSK